MGKKKNNKPKRKASEVKNKGVINKTANSKEDFRNWSKYEYIKYIAQAILIMFSLDYANREIMNGSGKIKSVWLTYDFTLAPIFASITFFIIIYLVAKFIDKIDVKKQQLIMILIGTVILLILYGVAVLGSKIVIGKAPFLVIFIILFGAYEYAKKKAK